MIEAIVLSIRRTTPEFRITRIRDPPGSKARGRGVKLDWLGYGAVSAVGGDRGRARTVQRRV